MNKRILSLIMALVTMLSIFTFPAHAASTLDEAMANVSVYARNTDLDWLRMNGSVKVQHYTYYNYRSEQDGTTKEIPAYCVDPRLYGVPALVPEGTAIKYSANSTVSDPKVMGICANGYPHIDLATLGVASVEEAYYATKTALWCYLLDTWDISKLSVNPSADQAAAARVLQATIDIYTRGMRWNKLVEPKLTAKPDRNTAYAATVNGASVYQQIFTVTTETWSIEPVLVSLAAGAPSGTKILDMNDREISSLNIADATSGDDGYSWQVKVVYPASAVEGEEGTVQLNLSSVVVQYELYFAKTLEADQYGNIQEYVLDTDPHAPVTASAISTYSSTPDDDDTPPPSGETQLKIVKVEEGTNNPLSGAVFDVLYPDGSAVGSFSTKDDGTITIPLDIVGNYTVTERIAPSFHLLPDIRTKNVTVVHGKTAEVTFTNAPYGSLRVEKVSDTGEGLSGVTVQIKDLSDGSTQSGKTGPGGVIEFSELRPGGFEVRELAGIEGWEPDTETVKTATVVSGEVSTVTLTNKELPGLRVVKYDRTSMSVLPDVTFEFFKDGTSIGEYKTDQMGEIVLTNITGTIRVVERQSVDTHITATNEQEIELKAGDGIRQLVFFNDLKPGIRLTKVDSADLSKPLANAKFKIEAVDGSWGPQELTTGADGSIDLSRLPATAMIVTEIDPPAGYLKDNGQRVIQLKPNENMEFVFTDSKKPVIHLIKLSASGDPLPGVTFRLAKIEDGSNYLDRTTDENGEIFWEGLDYTDPAVYSLKEISTVADHIPDPREYHIQVFPGRVSTKVLQNDRRPNLYIHKRDANDGSPIAHTIFLVKGADGHSIAEVETNDSGIAVVKNLLPGVVEIVEKSVPSPYLLDAPSQLATLFPNRDRDVYFENHKRPVVVVEKENSITHDPIPQTPFKFEWASNKSATGELRDLGTYRTNSEGKIELEVEDGWLKITEVEPVTGFAIKDSATQEGFVEAGKTTVFHFENTPLSAIVCWKFDSVNHSAVENAVFTVKYLSGNESGTGGTVIGTFKTSKNGSFTVTNLRAGSYIVEEVAVDEASYVIDTAPQTVYISGQEQDIVNVYFGDSPTGSLLIKKVSAADNSPLSDVEFLVTTANGTLVGNSNGKYVTDSAGCIRIDGQKPGTVLIAKESRAKEGYLLDSVAQVATIQAGRTVELEFRNQPCGNFLLTKKDSVTDSVLEGARFKITYADGSFVADENGKLSSNGQYYTDRNGQILLRNVVGTLVVTEEAAPKGFAINENTRTQTITVNPNDTQKLVVYDDPLCVLTVTKRDATDPTKLLANAEFTVTDGAGQPIGPNNGRYVTGETGIATITGIMPNTTVKIVESKAPTGYIKSDKTETIIVKSGAENSVVFDDEPTQTLVIRKYIDGTNYEPLAHVGFKVVDGSGAGVGPDGGTYFTDLAGEIVLTGLEPGMTITAYEFKTVDGMAIDGSPQSIQIKAGSVQHLTFFDKRLGSLVIKKMSSADKKTPLEGVEFLLTYADGRFVDNANGHLSSNGVYFTDSNGEIRINGISGTIVCTEQKSIPGYSLGSDRTRSVTVREDETQTLYYYNDPWQTVVIQKYVDGTVNKPLAGVTFLLTDGNGAPIGNGNGEYTTDQNGRITLSAPVGSTIVVREVRTVSGYTLNPNAQTITVKGGTTVQTVIAGSATTGGATVVTSGDGSTGNQLTFYDKTLGGIELIKVNEADHSQRIANATFEIRKMDGGLVTTITTDRNGRAYAPLEDGAYYAVEISVDKRFKLDPTPIYFEAVSGSTTTKTVTNKAFCGILIHKVDAETGKGIYGATFLLYDGNHNPIGEYTSDNNGNVYIEGLTESGRYYLREQSCEGYNVDKELKTVTVQSGQTTEITWKNVAIRGQIQITKYAAEPNTVTGQAAGTTLKGAVFEVVSERSGVVVDYITTDARGIAAITLPLGRYIIREVSSPAFWQVSSEKFDVTLEYPSQIIKLAAYDKPAKLNVTINKTGVKEVLAGSKMTYHFTVANGSNVALENFFWHDKLPYDISAASGLTTGTYNTRLTYRILYKTNCNDYRVLASNLLSTNNYGFQLNALPLQGGEVVTDIYFDFGTVPAGFQSTAKPTLTVSVSPTATDGYYATNRADAGGKYNGTWETANTSWLTTVRNLTPVKRVPLPKTGY